MDEKALSDLLSNLISGSTENDPSPGEESSGGHSRALMDSLKALAGQSGSPVEQAVSQFLNGEGELLEITRTSLAKGGSSAVEELSAMLTKQFGLSPLIAMAVATLLLKLLPSIGKGLRKTSPVKKKPRRKTTRKTASTKSQASSTKKKKKKPATRPRTAAGKKKTTAKGSKKRARIARKRKTSK